jgi:hypothetical protein
MRRMSKMTKMETDRYTFTCATHGEFEGKLGSSR